MAALEEAPAARAQGRRRLVGLGRARHSLGAGYSRLVQLMKVVLPATAVALLGLVVAWPQIVDDGGRFRVGALVTAAPDVEQLRMLKARFLGTDSNDQPYVVTAESAVQSMAGPKVLLLDQPKADLTTRAGDWVALQAALGTFDQAQETVHLTGGVNLFHDRGYELVTDTADIDLKAGSAVSHVPVQGQGPLGTIEAEGMVVQERGNRIFFTGKARLVLQSGGEGGR
ncbi:MAG: hypothetical protein OHK0024_12330 [Thalassobaculales bacterium]